MNISVNAFCVLKALKADQSRCERKCRRNVEESGLKSVAILLPVTFATYLWVYAGKAKPNGDITDAMFQGQKRCVF
jgi:hypothetical protein